MIAVIPIRKEFTDNEMSEIIAEAGGRAILIGEETEKAASSFETASKQLICLETASFSPARWSLLLRKYLEEQDLVIIPATPDGRDLAPRIAYELKWPLITGAIKVGPGYAYTVRHPREAMLEYRFDRPVVATILPGERGIEPLPPGTGHPHITVSDTTITAEPSEDEGSDALLLDVLSNEAGELSLTEAERVIAGGAGLGGKDAFELLELLATRLGAVAGATRVATDAGWLSHDRQIGSTGVTVRPYWYVALGISGASQHLAGVVDPEHVAAVNLDPSCPMMALAELPIVADAPKVLYEMVKMLSTDHLSTEFMSQRA